MAGKGVVRSLKNFTKGFSDVQIKVREATSNDAWGPSGTLMNEIAQLTYNQHDFIEVMDMIDKRLNDKGKNWRHVFKALLLLDYCLHVGSENVVLYAKENAYVVKTLKEFQHVEENGNDVGANVRQKAKDITNLLQDDNRLQDERRQRRQMRDRMAGVGDYMGEMTGIQKDGSFTNRASDDDDWELKRATEESKQQADEERKRRQGEDDDLAIALQLSEQEAREREQRTKNQLSNDSDLSLLFNPYSQPPPPPPQQQQIGWAPENGGLLGTNNNSNTLIFTNKVQNGENHQPVNNPYLQQQQQQQQQAFRSSGFQQPSFQQTQVTGISGLFSNNQQPQATFEQSAFPFDNTQQQQPFNNNIVSSQNPMVTGSRNPFGQQSSQGSQVFTSSFGQVQGPPNTSNAFTAFGQNSVMASSSSSPFDTFKSTPLSSLSPIAANYSAISSPSSPSFATTTSTAGQSRPITAKTSDDPHHEKLNSLLGSKDDGMDTFGNTGTLRIPFGTGYANTIKPQENGQSANTTGGTIQGFDVAFGLPSPGRSTNDQAPQQQSNSRNPFSTTGTNQAGYTLTPSTQPSPFNQPPL